MKREIRFQKNQLNDRTNKERTRTYWLIKLVRQKYQL